MKRALTIAAVTAPLMLLAACEQGSTATQQNTPPPAQSTIADSELPVPADFEDEAAQSITVSNDKQELDTIESEVN
jgi:hypothetical protein